MIDNFFYEFFQKPIIEHSGYNPINTIIYGIILLFVAFFIVFPFFNKKGIKFDFKFFLSVLPYIVLGSTVRVFEETGSASFISFFSRSANPLEIGFYFISPGIYILIGFFAIISLIFSIFVSKKFKVSALKVFALIGLIPLAPVIIFHLINLTHPIHFVGVFLFTGVIVAVLFFLFKLFKLDLLKNKLSLSALAAQTLDSVATFTAISFFSFSEQHFVPLFLIENFSPFSFIVLKVGVVLIILYLLEKEVEDENLKNFIKLFIIILGFAPGIRDAFSIGTVLI